MDTLEKVKEKASRIKLLLLDVDGVLTDGRIVYDSKGRDSKFFDVISGVRRAGYQQGSDDKCSFFHSVVCSVCGAA